MTMALLKSAVRALPSSPQSLATRPSVICVRDGVRLHRQHWPVSQARGTVVLVHGIAEHLGRHTHVAQRLQSWGWQVVAFDQRGHGRSDGRRGALSTPDDLVKDVAEVVAQVRREVVEGPLILMGHSMGGLVVGAHALGLLDETAETGSHIDALVMLSPALDVSGTAPAVLQRALPWLDRVVPWLTVRARFDAADICRDPRVVRAYLHDPLVHDRISVRLGHFIQSTGRRVRAAASRWVVPTLLLYAGADRIVHPQGSLEFAWHAAPSVVRAHGFERLAHELHNEPEQDAVMAHLQCWLNELWSDG